MPWLRPPDQFPLKISITLFSSHPFAIGESLMMAGEPFGHSHIQTTAHYTRLTWDFIQTAATRITGRIGATSRSTRKLAGRRQFDDDPRDNQARPELRLGDLSRRNLPIRSGAARRDCRQIGPVQLSGDCVCLNGHP